MKSEMKYQSIVEEIIRKAEIADQIAGDVFHDFHSDWHDVPYGKGTCEGVNPDGVAFRNLEFADSEEYIIPFEWLDYSEEQLRRELEKERKVLENDKAKNDKALLARLKSQYEA